MSSQTVLASFLILAGLICLTMSGSYWLGSDIKTYIGTFIQICLWIGIPILIVGMVLFFLRRKKDNHS